MSPPVLRRYRAERLLRSEFAGLRSKVLAIVRSQLRGKGVTIDVADLEACYAQAWQGLYAAVLGGEQVENPSAWLVLVTFRRAIDEGRSAARRELALDTERTAFEPDLAGGIDDRAKLRQVLEGLRSRLSTRECEAASLCYLQGLTRAQAAERMGISQARMGKLMEGAGPSRPGVAGKMSELLGTIKSGGWCEQQSSLIRAFAFGVLDPEGERHTLAVTHCRECPACRMRVASLRGLAAVLPLPPLRLLLGGATAGATGVAGVGTSGAGVGASAGVGAGGGAGAGTGTGGIEAGTGVSAGVGAGTGAGAGATGGTGAVGVTSAGTSLGVAAGGGTSVVGGIGWSGVAGSLTAKLAIAAVALLGAGYLVLGSSPPSHPQRGSPASHARLRPRVLASGAPAPARASLPARFRPSHTKRSVRRSAPANAPITARVHSVRTPSTQEFSPERTQSEAPGISSSQAPSPHGPTGPAGEFGIE